MSLLDKVMRFLKECMEFDASIMKTLRATACFGLPYRSTIRLDGAVVAYTTAMLEVSMFV